ncbi:MAG: hypothetical protein HYX47_17280 [Burkholderiales bacterium]|nr:hypothetical protein [Burkholderiales bacterium]
MKNAHGSFKSTVAGLLLGSAALAGFAQPAQVPLLTRSSTVEPNILLMFDDSGSMNNTYLYQESTSSFWGTNVTVGGNGIDPPSNRETYAKCSPQVNRLAYDPAVLYKPRTNADGTVQANGSTNNARTNAPCDDGSNNPYVYAYKGGGLRYDQVASYDRTTIQSGNTYTKSAARTDCAGANCTYGEEIQNYANWFKYHRTRLDMARTAVSQAFIDLPPTFRLGWGVINTMENGTLDSGVTLYDATTRGRFYTWIEGLTAPGNTPNRKALDTAGKYFSRDDSDGPWGTTPRYQSTGSSNVASPTSNETKTAHAACRRSYSMLVTDGYYNDSFTIANVDNTTGSTITSPRGGSFQYSPGFPYKDSYSNTMADIAMKYWVNDLRTDLANNVAPVPGLDPAFWQHMNFYAISLGLEGTLPQTPAKLAQLTSGAQAWPQPGPDTLEAIDDMWHATINGRGDMLNAKDATELTGSLQALVGQILKASASQAGVAVSTVNLISGTRKFVPVYTTGDWTGNLIATNLDPDTGNETSTAWQIESKASLTGVESTNTIGDFSKRNIQVGNAAVSGSRAVSFTYAAMTGASLTGSMTGVVNAALINYLRGDRSAEGSLGIYRGRNFLLGDIVNSTPAFVKPAIDYGYANLPAGAAASAYIAYLTQKSALAEGAVFVGANDGMLHVFAENDGREVFAYVPRAVLPTLNQLADNAYSHRYYVDGPITQGDYYDGTNWKTAVIATTGAGSKAVFAIDATTPVSLSATSILWEINDGVTNFDELGNVLAEVRIGIVPTSGGGTWAAIFGNGYYSKSGKAQLFVVDLKTGALIRKIDTLAGGNNGLGGVRLVLDSNQRVLGAYGGDLKGNMWKFDLSDASASNWSVGFSGAPLFQAKDGAGTIQPFTAAPFVIPHPNGGYLVAAGTGKFFDLPDITTTGVQSAYGLRDTITFGATSTPAGSTVTGTSSLVLQTVSQAISISRIITAFDDTTSTQVVNYYKVSSNPIDWATKRGWYFNLPFAGQRTVYPVDAYFGRLARVDTILPGATGTDPCAAGTPGVGYNYIIDALNGGSPQVPLLDTNGDGNIDSSDYSGASGYSTSADGRDIALIRQSTSTATKKDIFIVGSSGDAIKTSIDLCKAGLITCGSGITKRSWRQLFLR